MFDRRLPQLAHYLESLAHKGFAANTVIDIGACYGTLELLGSFPDAYHIFVEPQSALIPGLKRWLDVVDGEIHQTAVSDEIGTASLHPHAQNASLLHPGPEAVAVTTLDTLFADRQFVRPVVLKTDCQGKDYALLSKAQKLLLQVDLLICETSLQVSSKGQNRFSDMVSLLQKAGFDLHDIVGHHIRPSDAALAQIDLAFLKTTHPLMAPRPWQ